MELVSVAALAENRVIGNDGRLPWPKIPEDRRQYLERVAGHPVILGRVTFESMREDPAGSTQVVLSRSTESFDVETAHHAGGVEEALQVAGGLGDDVAYVIGGAGIYDLFQPHLDRMVLSRVPGEYEGDAYYPEWDDDEWDRVDAEQYDEFTLETWERTN